MCLLVEDRSGTGEERVGLGGNFLRLRNVIDLVGESLELIFSKCVSVYQTIWGSSE